MRSEDSREARGAACTGAEAGMVGRRTPPLRCRRSGCRWPRPTSADGGGAGQQLWPYVEAVAPWRCARLHWVPARSFSTRRDGRPPAAARSAPPRPAPPRPTRLVRGVPLLQLPRVVLPPLRGRGRGAAVHLAPPAVHLLALLRSGLAKGPGAGAAAAVRRGVAVGQLAGGGAAALLQRGLLGALAEGGVVQVLHRDGRAGCVSAA